MKKILLTICAALSINAVSAQCNELFISEYVEGSGNNKAIEIYNPTNNAINLNNYWVKRYSNGSSAATGGGIVQLSGTIQPNTTFLLVNGQTTTAPNSPACDTALQNLTLPPNNGMLDVPYPAPTYMNGNDAIALEKGTSASSTIIVDIFGVIGEDPGTAWTNTPPFTGAGTWITSDHSLQRKASVKQGVSINPSLFDALAEYDTLPKNTWTELGKHLCDCFTSINEYNNDVNVSIYPNPTENSNVIITASEGFKSLKLVNNLGETIIEENMISNATNKFTLSTDLLVPGVYFVKLTHKDNTSIKKLIKK